jgi:aminocarboxymuconate-semialdehyde decarboxylase
MTIVDVHAHWVPETFRRAIAETGTWYGMTGADGELGLRGMRMSIAERIDDMDALGVDMQMLSPQAGFYQYHRDEDTAGRIARECNDEIHSVVQRHPDRFCGVGTLPMQSIPNAIEELRRIMGLGLKGAEISDHVGGSTYEEEKYFPFWDAVESMGAVIFFHQGFDHRSRIGKYHLDNSIGNLVEHTLNFAVLAVGGVVDRFPGLKLLFAHAGGFIPYAVSRMDKVAGAFAMDNPVNVDAYRPAYDSLPQYSSLASRPPTEYLRSFYYDSCTFSARNIRFLVDTVGVDRVVFGTDSPAPMVLTDGVRWIQGLDLLTEAEKKQILQANATTLLSLD